MRAVVAVVFAVGCSSTADVVPAATVEDAASDGSIFEAEPLDSMNADVEAPCAPVQRFVYTTASTVPLSCGADAMKPVIDQIVPSFGRAAGRARFAVHHTGASGVIHFWNVRVELGTPELTFGIGDDVCPGTTSKRANVGTGTLSSGHDHAKVFAYQGASPCTDGSLAVEGAELEVFVEDPRPACAGKDIAATSWYREKGYTETWKWPTMMAEVVSTSITTSGPSESLTILGVIEGTPLVDPNMTCGSEAATLVMQTMVDGSIDSTQKDAVPASMGMGHLVLASETERVVGAGKHEVSLFAGSNFTGDVQTGGCCGDATIIAIRRR